MGKRISKNVKKQLLNFLFLLFLIGLTLIILLKSNRELNFENIRAFLKNSNPWLLAAAFGCMLLFIAFEGMSIGLISRRLGHKKRWFSPLAYSSADVYYSALTPSASGGQPASAFYMVRDGIDAGSTTFILLFNLVAYTAAIFVIGAAAFLLRPRLFLQFGFWVKFLVAGGLVVQGLLLAFFIACMCCHKGVLKFGNGIISLLRRIRIVKNPEKWRAKLAEEVEKYRAGFEEMKKRRALFVQALLLNVAQRTSQILVTCFVCLAADKNISFCNVFAMQAFVLIGYTSVPLPGGVGAFEYLYLRIYGLLYEDAFILSAMMVSRGISYYLCIVVSGTVTLLYHILAPGRRKKETTEKNIQENFEDEKYE